MPKHHTAFLNTERKAEESGGDAFGLAPFYSFLQDFNAVFRVRTRPNFYKHASQYLSGLFLRDRRRNIEKISQTVPNTDYQSMHHFLAHSPWNHRELNAKIASHANRLLGGSPETTLIIDPTSFPKKGHHSVGVSRQYSGRLGKVDNCQLGVMAALAKGRDATLVNSRLYLPKAWCQDLERCRKAGVPEDQQTYRSTDELALELVDEADQHQMDYQWVGMDAEFAQPWLLMELHQRGKQFLIDVRSNTYLYRHHPKLSFKSPQSVSPCFRIKHKPEKASRFLPRRSKQGWKRLCFRRGRKGDVVAEFRHRYVWLWDGHRSSQPLRCHLIIRRTKDHGSNTWRYKYSLSNAPDRTPLKRLAHQQSQRFWVEQAIRDAKDSLGLNEYQCRGWRAWHHHMSLTFLAGLYVLKTRLENRKKVPLLSIGDVKEMLAFLLPKRILTITSLWDQIKARHIQLQAVYSQAEQRSFPLLV